MGWKTIDDMDLDGKVVLTRVDFNVPVEDGRVTDTTRIERVVPTLSDILAKGGKPVMLAHFGRPKGQRVETMTLAQIREALIEPLLAAAALAPDGLGYLMQTALGVIPVHQLPAFTKMDGGKN